ncbi:MAG: hypothetical protein E7369_05460 [Clostridiales bacterium]|nr:hypothetical protein [Clostridiales bacterium]
MTVQDVVKLSATYLDKENVLNYLEGKGEGSPTEVNSLTVCANVVINELACTYIPMIKSETIKVNDGKLYFNDLTETPLKIVKVCDKDGKELAHTFYPKYLAVDSDCVSIEYKYMPPNLGLTDKIDYEETSVPVRLLAFGTIAEYALLERDFDKSVMWRNRYNSLLTEMISPKNVKIRGRVFI